MSDKNSDTITISLDITMDDVKVLKEELNDCDDSVFVEFVEKVLKQVQQKAEKLEVMAKHFKNSKNYLED